MLSLTQVAYLDLGGSGNETHAHVVSDQPALILRIYGRGRSGLPQDGEWQAPAENFTLLPGTR